MKQTLTIEQISELIGKGKTFVRGLLKERDAPKHFPKLGVPKRYDAKEVEDYFFSK